MAEELRFLEDYERVSREIDYKYVLLRQVEAVMSFASVSLETPPFTPKLRTLLNGVNVLEKALVYYIKSDGTYLKESKIINEKINKIDPRYKGNETTLFNTILEKFGLLMDFMGRKGFLEPKIIFGRKGRT